MSSISVYKCDTIWYEIDIIDENGMDICENTLKCLDNGTAKTINFPFVSNGKLNDLGVPIFKHIWALMSVMVYSCVTV